MTKYFRIASGLRGAYIDDSSFLVAVDTRRELRAIVERECELSREAYGFGGAKRLIAGTVAAAWVRFAPYPYVIGFGRSRSIRDRPFGVFISRETKADFEEWSKANAD